MKASELVKALIEAINEFGDCPLHVEGVEDFTHVSVTWCRQEDSKLPGCEPDTIVLTII